MINQDFINDQFPILRRQSHGHDLCYLDSANTSLTPEMVLQKMNEYYRDYNANVHRSLYESSEKATLEYGKAREKVQQFLGAKSQQEIIFTKNASEALNLVVQTWGRENLSEGDTVVLSLMEHHSNIVPWQILQKERGFKIHFLSLTEDGRLDLDEYQSVLQQQQVKVVSIVHQSNVLGTINPIKKMAELAHQHGSLFMADGSQSAPHMPVNVSELAVDFFVCTGHKMYGPTGVGVLYGKKELLESMPPFLGGGDMIRTVETSGSTWNELPYKFEAGTPNIAGVIGLGAAIDFINEIGINTLHDHEQRLMKKALHKLKEIPGLQIFGPQTSEERGATITFSLEGIHPHDIASMLGESGVCIRAGHHCAQPLMEYLQVPATARISFAAYSAEDDISTLINAIKEVQHKFK